MERMKKVTLFKVTTIALILTMLIFFVSYPSVSDFDYWHMEVSKVVEQTKYIPLEDTNSGFYIFTVILHILTSFSYDIIPSFPLQLIPFLFLLTAIFKSTKNEFICIFIVLYYLNTLSNPSLLTWGSHEIGFLLFLTVLLVITIYLESKKISKFSVCFMLILLVITVNFISYKMDLLIVSFLFIFSIIEKFESIKHQKFRNNTFFTIVLIGIIVTLTFNIVFYKEFLPSIRSTSETSFEFSTGLSKLFSVFSNDSSSSLSPFLLQPLRGIMYVRIFQYFLVYGSLFFSLLLLIKKIALKQSLSLHDKAFLGLVGSGFLIFVIYNSCGFADLSFLFFSGIVGFIVISNYNSNKYVKLVFIAILLLLATNFYVINEKINDEYISGQSDQNHFKYLMPVSNWYAKYGIDIINFDTASDVFTRGYFMKELANKNRSNYPIVLNSNDILFLYQVENYTLPNENIKDRFIINYRECYLTIEDWKFFKPFSLYRKNIETNSYLNSIYTSGDVVIYDKKGLPR